MPTLQQVYHGNNRIFYLLICREKYEFHAKLSEIFSGCPSFQK